MRQLSGIPRPKNSVKSDNWKYTIENLSDAPSKVMIYDAIGAYGITAEGFTSELANVKGPLEVHVNSEGGDVFDGIAIYNALVTRDEDVTVIVDSLAASIASIISMAASPGQLLMAKNSTMMIHEGQGVCAGNSGDFTKMAALLEMVSDNIASIYADRTGKPSSYWREQMKNETWFTADKAVNERLADGIAAANDKTPKRTNSMTTANSGLKNILGLESMPVDWEPVTNKALPVHHTATTDTPWDGPAAVAAMPNEASVLQYCHAWQNTASVDSDNDDHDEDADDLKSNYKFPHHEHKGGPASLPGVRNGLARLSQAHIPDSDISGVKAHLQAHLDDGTKSDDGNSSESPDNSTFLKFSGKEKNNFLSFLEGAK